MPELPDLGPLSVTTSAGGYRIALARPTDLTMELPLGFEDALREGLAPLLAEEPKREFVLDLENTPGLSSRQLGVMLALQKALRPRHEELPLAGVSGPVRRLLDLMRVAKLFEIRD